jgi:hypothetical protein
VALGAVVVDVEDQVVGGGVPDLEVDAGEGLELAQQVDRLVEVHREGRAALGEAFDRDIGGAEAADGVLHPDQLGEVAQGADLEADLARVEDRLPGGAGLRGVAVAVCVTVARTVGGRLRGGFLDLGNFGGDPRLRLG